MFWGRDFSKKSAPLHFRKKNLFYPIGFAADRRFNDPSVLRIAGFALKRVRPTPFVLTPVD
jgi:hypothetical protein